MKTNENIWKFVGGMKAGISILLICISTFFVLNGKQDTSLWATQTQWVFVALFGSNTLITIATQWTESRKKAKSPDEGNSNQNPVG